MGERRAVWIDAGDVELEGALSLPDEPAGIVVFAHGSGSSRQSPRNVFVADELRSGGLGTLLFDLLSPDEERIDARTRHLRFDIPLLARRVVAAVDWLATQPGAKGLPIGTFGASTGAAAALIAAAERPELVRAVVSRGGRPDLAADALPRVRVPSLFIVGGNDVPVIGLNEQAIARMRVAAQLEIIPGASHLFEEPGALEEVARRVRKFFQVHLASNVRPLASGVR